MFEIAQLKIHHQLTLVKFVLMMMSATSPLSIDHYPWTTDPRSKDQQTHENHEKLVKKFKIRKFSDFFEKNQIFDSRGKDLKCHRIGDKSFVTKHIMATVVV